MIAGVTVQVRLNGLKRIGSDLRGFARIGEGRDAFQQAAAIYSAAMRRRFVINARGGGEWPPLKPSTLRHRAASSVRRLNVALAVGDIDQDQFDKRIGRARASARKRRKNYLSGAASTEILRDTGTLFRALEIGNYGNRLTPLSDGVRFGFSDAAEVSHNLKGGAVTIGRLAYWHHTGAGHNPVRRILVAPDDGTKRRIQVAIQRGVDALVRRRGAR